ncbi:pyridoxamine 5'-phosphate oxidase family protein [Stappia stellulata]|uniref:pyridoxamine 5'-phosphate oxidase family protein n=1 Tax=Stappia stellulata TaxID=71235 RepID=UPI0006881056|nr:pyridoxamine 5'-phosphate oxidase family protein [Stappia stellulata]
MAELIAARQRVEFLLRTARFVTLATADPETGPWASTVNYILCEDNDIRLLWYSMRDAQHSRNIERTSAISGSIFRTDLTPEQSPLGLDGVQFSGHCRAVPVARVANVHEEYYRLNFPDEALRKQWMLPLDQFTGAGPRRFYEFVLEKMWLLDIERWLLDKEDRRFEVNLNELAASNPTSGGE